MSTRACMGGWCKKRDKCHHYHATSIFAPAERLCLPGEDGLRLERVHGMLQVVRVFDWRRPEAPRLAEAH